MILQTIKWILLSLILIILIHYLFNFFKDNLTIPKTKDLVTKPLEKYKVMESIINKDLEKFSNNKTNYIDEYSGTTKLDSINTIDINYNNNNNNYNNNNNNNNMKNEFKNFFNELNDI